MKMKCELCSGRAESYCESDQARLCFGCDADVHPANFLVAKHSRVLLCYVCQAPTEWSGSGAQLDPVPRICSACIVGDRDGGQMFVNGGDDGSCTDEEEEETDSDGSDIGESEDDDD